MLTKVLLPQHKRYRVEIKNVLILEVNYTKCLKY